jgi:predicted transcriptional regulator
MARSRSTSSTPRPTDAELGILAALWSNGPSSVREVFRTIGEERGIGYSSVLKLMQIMTEKGLLKRDESVRPQIYAPVRTQRATQKHLVGDLLDRAFAGSPGSLVLQALSSKSTTAEERDRIRAMLDQLEEGA